MTPTVLALGAVAVLAVAMVVWAALTGSPAVAPLPARRRPLHSRAARGEATQRLRPAAPPREWLPHRERPGGEAQLLPPREELPWVD